MIATAVALVGTAAFAAPAQAASCGVEGDGRLWCSNDTTSVYAQAAFETPNHSPVPIVDTLYASSRSWFACAKYGQAHGGGNSVWYQTRGDVNGRTGYVPASAVHTSIDPAPGLRAC